MNVYKYLMRNFAYLLRGKVLALVLMDLLVLPLVLFVSVWLRLGVVWDIRLNYVWWLFVCLPMWTIPIFIKLGLYRALIRFIDDKVVYVVFLGVSLSVLILSMVIFLSDAFYFPRSSIIIFWAFASVYIGGSRFLVRGVIRKLYYHNPKSRKVAIYGTGIFGIQLANYLNSGNDYRPIFFIDDTVNNHNSTILGMNVYALSEIKYYVERYNIQDLLLAVPNATRALRSQIVSELQNSSVYVKTIPSIDGLISGKLDFSNMMEIDIEDLLGRDEIHAVGLKNNNVYGKNILITGAGGSIGSELCNQIAKLNPSSLTILDLSEYSIYTIDLLLRERFPSLTINTILGSVTDSILIDSLMKKYMINIVYHAAAYKHVPLVESNCISGVYNNVIGTYVIATSALKHNIDSFILISTDKAVRPTNIMGTTKRVSELIIQACAYHSSTTIFSMVRFGNVLGSSGSVIPLFKKQIKSGGPVTVTHPDVIRYFMTIHEAVSLVIEAGSMATGGEVFVLDMGEPVKISDLARKMIYLSGLAVKDSNNPIGDIEIKYVGLRDGEKLYEELLIGNNSTKTTHERIMKANEPFIFFDKLVSEIEILRLCINSGDSKTLLCKLKSLVPEASLNVR